MLYRVSALPSMNLTLFLTNCGKIHYDAQRQETLIQHLISYSHVRSLLGKGSLLESTLCKKYIGRQDNLRLLLSL
jgi:hypothetical protein